MGRDDEGEGVWVGEGEGVWVGGGEGEGVWVGGGEGEDVWVGDDEGGWVTMRVCGWVRIMRVRVCGLHHGRSDTSREHDSL